MTPAKRGRGNKVKVLEEPQTSAERRASLTWAQRLKRVFNIDIETCCECAGAGAVKVIAFIEDPIVIRKLLDHLKDKSETNEPFPLPESREPPGGVAPWRWVNHMLTGGEKGFYSSYTPIV